MTKKNGFTLIELLVAMAILVVLMVLTIAALNPQVLIGKANDSRRKRDLGKIRIAFEEYYNDKGYYPSQEKLDSWNIVDNCGKQVVEISKYLKNWLCDPFGNPYKIIVGLDWFKVVTNLENKKDKDIPEGWYEDTSYTRYTASFLRNEVNYGTSSLNVLWYEGESVSSSCGNLNFCLGGSSLNECNDLSGIGCSAPNFCYQGDHCVDSCMVGFCN